MSGFMRRSTAFRRRHRTFLPTAILSILFWIFSTPAIAARESYVNNGKSVSQTQSGIASWYGAHEAGRKTASGIVFDPTKITAAHRTLPLGTCVRVTHLGNGRLLIVPIIDRGPYIGGRLIDLSEAAADLLGMKWAGRAHVLIEVLPSCLTQIIGRAR